MWIWKHLPQPVTRDFHLQLKLSLSFLDVFTCVLSQVWCLILQCVQSTPEPKPDRSSSPVRPLFLVYPGWWFVLMSFPFKQICAGFILILVYFNDQWRLNASEGLVKAYCLIIVNRSEYWWFVRDLISCLCVLKKWLTPGVRWTLRLCLAWNRHKDLPNRDAEPCLIEC